jgi:CBS domain-containing protein/sporulation protein YlmC with PRC-barrel domain
MTSFTTFYLSRIIGSKIYDENGKSVGIVKDLLMDSDLSIHSSERPLISGIKVKYNNSFKFYSNKNFNVEKGKGKIKIICSQLVEIPDSEVNHSLFLAKTFLDKQIVDLNGKKLVRVNDVRLVTFSYGTFVLAVDIGIEGLLRRIGIAIPIKFILSLFGRKIPSKFILWDDVAAIDFSKQNIKLSKSYLKLQTLHPSDLADIIEDLGKKASARIFSALDEEKAADVLEELEPDTQVHVIESLSIEKAADVLEKMPSDEVADILDVLEDEKAELLLNEMEKDTSQEVRELLNYPEKSVGSIMTTDVLTFKENNTIEDVLHELRIKKPEHETMYNLFVTNENNHLIATFSLRDIVISQPETQISQIMKPSLISLLDYQDIDDVAEIVSKYNLLAIPVVNKDHELEGMIVIDDVIDDLMNKRRTNK